MHCEDSQVILLAASLLKDFHEFHTHQKNVEKCSVKLQLVLGTGFVAPWDCFPKL